MRERQKLETALGAVRALENELHDATGLIEMAEAENDAAMVADAEKASPPSGRARRKAAAAIHAVGRGGRQ